MDSPPASDHQLGAGSVFLVKNGPFVLWNDQIWWVGCYWEIRLHKPTIRCQVGIWGLACVMRRSIETKRSVICLPVTLMSTLGDIYNHTPFTCWGFLLFLWDFVADQQKVAPCCLFSWFDDSSGWFLWTLHILMWSNPNLFLNIILIGNVSLQIPSWCSFHFYLR